MKKFLLLTLLAVSSCGMLEPSFARWKADYAQNTAEERDWYRRQTTTPEWRERVKASWYNSCCDHGDVVEAQFQKVNGKWAYRLPGTQEWVPLPDDIVQIDVATPHGKPVLFMDSTGRNFGPICFFPGAAGY